MCLAFYFEFGTCGVWFVNRLTERLCLMTMTKYHFRMKNRALFEIGQCEEHDV